jgi:hypothetical protein
MSPYRSKLAVDSKSSGVESSISPGIDGIRILTSLISPGIDGIRILTSSICPGIDPISPEQNEPVNLISATPHDLGASEIHG